MYYLIICLTEKLTTVQCFWLRPHWNLTTAQCFLSSHVLKLTTVQRFPLRPSLNLTTVQCFLSSQVLKLTTVQRFSIFSLLGGGFFIRVRVTRWFLESHIKNPPLLYVERHGGQGGTLPWAGVLYIRLYIIGTRTMVGALLALVIVAAVFYLCGHSLQIC